MHSGYTRVCNVCTMTKHGSWRFTYAMSQSIMLRVMPCVLCCASRIMRSVACAPIVAPSSGELRSGTTASQQPEVPAVAAAPSCSVVVRGSVGGAALFLPPFLSLHHLTPLRHARLLKCTACALQLDVLRVAHWPHGLSICLISSQQDSLPSSVSPLGSGRVGADRHAEAHRLNELAQDTALHANACARARSWLPILVRRQ